MTVWMRLGTNSKFNIHAFTAMEFVGLSPADGTFKVLTPFTTDLILDASGYFAP